MTDNLFNTVYNPDVLSCLANLSNDEVFTPPEIVNQMLDMLPQELFSNPDTTFLDPACKTGVFLREIAKRLIEGLEPQFPDLQERLGNIVIGYRRDKTPVYCRDVKADGAMTVLLKDVEDDGFLADSFEVALPSEAISVFAGQASS